jgi:hypothetical protein
MYMIFSINYDIEFYAAPDVKVIMVIQIFIDRLIMDG